MYTLRCLACVVAGILCLPLSGQTLDEVFDDGEVILARSVIRTDLTSLFTGQATLSYERLLGAKQLGVEAGVGLKTGEYSPGLANELFGLPDYDLSDASGTNSLFLNLRMYQNTIYRTTYLFVLGLRSRGFSFDQPDMNTFRLTDVSASGGIHILVFDRVTLDPHAGVVYRMMSDNAFEEVEKRNPSQSFKFNILFQVGLEVGYMF